MKSASNESQIETMLEKLPPEPGSRLAKRLSSAPWTPRGVKRQRALIVIYVAVALFIAFIGLTPQGRAFAQTIFKFFTTTDQTSIPLSREEIDLFYSTATPYALSLVEVTPVPLWSEYCSNPEDVGTYQCEVQGIEKQRTIDLKEFSTNPSGYTFVNVMYYFPSFAIYYENSNGSILLRQGIGDFPLDSDWDKVPSSAVQPVRIGEYDGEYVAGFFGLKNGDTEATWIDMGDQQRIRWREGRRWFEILAFAGPGTSGYLDKLALTSLATNMIYQPESSEQNANVNFDFIPNLPLAEKICECDILQPGKLPNERTHFDHIKYDPERKSITLSYGHRTLRIVQTPLESALIEDLDSYKNVETVNIGGVTGQYGVSPEHRTIWESASPPVFTTDSTYAVLLWQKDGMVYQIYFDQSFSGGGQLTKEQMIEIAESLH